MLLSIIVPVYNMAGGGKLTYCMESLLAQTLPEFEIIAVDDCSTDDSWRILQEYERKHPHGDQGVSPGGHREIPSAVSGEYLL